MSDQKLAKVPVLKIDDVALDCETFSWPFVSGPVSPQISFTVSNPVDDQLQRLSNPVTLHMDVTQLDGERPKRSIVKVEKLYLVERQRVDYATVRWVIADARILYADVRISASFNMPRVTNDKTLPTFNARGGGLLVGAGAANPDFDSIAKFRYVGNTLQALGELRFATPTAGVTTPGKPWTAMAAARWIFQELVLRYGMPINVVMETDDNGYQLQQDDVHEERFPALIARMLNSARATFFPGPDGSWIVYSLGAQANAEGLGGYDGGGDIEVRDISRLVPRDMVLRFPQVHETRWDFFESGDSSSSTSERTSYEFTIDNVVQLPEAVGDKLAGTWVTIDEAIALWNADSANPWPNGNLTKLDLQLLGVSSALVFFYAYNSTTLEPDPILTGRIHALQDAYRHVFRIPDVWMNMIERWEPTLVGVLDPITGQQQPSPVWCDYTTIPSTRLPTGMRVPDAARRQSIITYAFGAGAGAAPPLASAKQAPAEIHVVNHDLGIFRVDFRPDKQRFVLQYIMGALKEDLVLDLARSSIVQSLLLESVGMAPTFHFTTLLSVTFNTPNDSRRFYETRVRSANAGDPFAYEYFFAREPARWKWEDGKSKAQLGDKGQVILSGYELVNGKILDAVAQAYFNRIAFSFVSRLSGVAKRHGYDPTKDRPQGNVKGVGITFSKDGGLESIHDRTPPVQAQDLRELLPTDVRQYIFREIG